MDDEKEGDIRVPLALTIFFLCLIAGGVFLVFYVFLPDLSQPWYPTAALILIACPWLFWLLICIYTCIKRCCSQGSPAVDHQVSRRQSTTRNGSSRDPEMPLAHSAV